MNFFHPKQFTPLCIKTLNQISCICTNACSDVQSNGKNEQSVCSNDYFLSKRFFLKMIEIKSHISQSQVSAVYTTNMNNENKYIPSCPCSLWMLSSTDWSQGELCCWLLWSKMGSAARSRHSPQTSTALETPCRWKSPTEKAELIALRVRRITRRASEQGQSWEGEEKRFKMKVCMRFFFSHSSFWGI